MDIVKVIAQNPIAYKRIQGGRLWAFVCSLPAGPECDCLKKIVLENVITTEDLANELHLPRAKIKELHRRLYRKYLEWRRGGARNSMTRIDPPKHLRMRSMVELESALTFNLDEETITRIDTEVKPTWMDESNGDAELSSVDPSKVTQIKSRMRTKPEPLYSTGPTRFALAAAIRSPHRNGLEKIEGCDIEVRGEVYTFYTDRKKIYLAGLPDTEVHSLTLNNKEYLLQWDPQKDLHHVINLTGETLFEFIEALEQDSQSASFDIR